MLRVMRIFTGMDLHKLVLHVMVKVYLHSVTMYYLQAIRFDQFSARQLRKQRISCCTAERSSDQPGMTRQRMGPRRRNYNQITMHW